jgi:protein-S-isoprenylcysteine O-methyltransferase Ste14
MRATNFEFRYRFYIVTLIFWLGFSCYQIDHQNAAESIERFLGFTSKFALQLTFGFGALMVAAGAAIRTWATAYIHTDVVHDMDLHTDRLVADGPYRYVRNPLYLGILLLSVGMGLMASRLGWFVLIAANAMFYLRLALREEAALTETQGESYLAYKRAVPRIVPSLTPRLPSSGRAPQWAQAFIGEGFMWAFAVLTLLFAFTLWSRRMWQLTGLILLGYLIGQIILRQKKKKTEGSREVPIS